ncbi:hypothetical protein Ocin01_11960 [Orchesella cincta]|uniref:Mannosylglycerate hydrolase MGH1-like glycoside hydrolase domain-containing protein n=1 Tax=Orchesella cincta TaxID=48709 RepID=A0A1D2MNQ7_ORCCI|nr:hypothetical protein Ocin01_11960 [Orchesella cincta]
MEHSASSEQTDDPYHGGLGYRPSFNSEMYANAITISKIARINNDTRTAEEFEGRAAAIRQGILDHLWDDERTFFYHVFREDNPNYELLDTREEIGFYPWRFGVPDPQEPKYALAWEHLFDPQGFNSTYVQQLVNKDLYGLMEIKRHSVAGGMVINSLAAQLRDYGTTNIVNVNTFLEVLHNNHSEHYAHSTYVDNVLGDLIGIVPQPDNIRYQPADTIHLALFHC